MKTAAILSPANFKIETAAAGNTVYVAFAGGLGIVAALVGSAPEPHGQFSLFKTGAQPSAGLERLSEEGKHGPLDNEIKAAIAAGAAGALFESDPIKDFGKSVTSKVRVTSAFPDVSAVAMIAPSPDWFAGVALAGPGFSSIRCGISHLYN